MNLILPDAALLKTAYDRDLKASFPPAELKPLRNIQTMTAAGLYHPWCLMEGETLLGEAFLWLGHPGWALLDYLCVSSARRGGGLGASLLAALQEAESPETVILAESEAPESAPDAELARRRLGFYARNGLRTAGYNSEIFGVHYKTLYLAPSPVSDEVILREHRHIYQSTFPSSKFEQYVRIPRDPSAPPVPQIPWNEDP